MGYDSHIPFKLVMTATQTEVRVYACIRAIQGTRGETCMRSHSEIGMKAEIEGCKPIDRSAVTRAVKGLKARGYLVEYEGGLRCCEPVEGGLLDAFAHIRGTQFYGLIHDVESVKVGDDSSHTGDDLTPNSDDSSPESQASGDDSSPDPVTIHHQSGDDSSPDPSIYTARVNPPSKPTVLTQSSSDTTTLNPESSALPFEPEPATAGDEVVEPELAHLASIKVPLSDKERAAFGERIAQLWRECEPNDIETLFWKTYGDSGRSRRLPNGEEYRILSDLQRRFPWEWLLPMIVAARVKGAALVNASSFAEPWLKAIGPVRRNDAAAPIATGATIHRLKPGPNQRGSPPPPGYVEISALEVDGFRRYGLTDTDVRAHVNEHGRTVWLIKRERRDELWGIEAATLKGSMRSSVAT